MCFLQFVADNNIVQQLAPKVKGYFYQFYTLNDEPHPQLLEAFGLDIEKLLPARSSL